MHCFLQSVQEEFEWVTGVPFDYANWDTDEPNGQEDENCVEYRVDTHGWNDVGCD